MLALLLLYIYIYTLSVCSGILITKNLFRVEYKNPFLYFWTGIIFIAVISRLWIIFSNTSALGLQFSLIGVSVLSALINRSIFIRAINIKLSAFLAFTILFILFFSAQQSISYDEGLYHASFINWLNEFGLVKGVANTHGRLGFDSNWHLLASVFNLKGIFNQPLNQINGLILISTLLYFEWEKKANTEATNFIHLTIILLFFPLLFVYHVIDPSADYIVICWVLLIVYELYYYHKNADEQHRKSIITWCLLSISFILTVKLSAYLIVILAAPLVIYIWNDKIAVIKVIAFSMIIAVTWLYSNYILSGYFVYPFVQIDAFSPIWKVPSYIAEQELTGIKYTPITRWANISFEEAGKLSSTEMLKMWFASVRIVEKLLFLGSIVSILLSLVISWRKSIPAKVIGIWCIAGFAAIILTAPDFRFYALYCFSALAIIAANIKQLRISNRHMQIVVTLSAIISLVLYNHLKKVVNNPDKVLHAGLAVNLLKPEPYPSPDADSVLIDKTKFYLLAQDELAWDVIPYLYTPYVKGISLIEPGDLSKGFYIDSTKGDYEQR